MRKLIVAAAILASSAAGASAADLGAVPYRPAPMIAAPYDWSGFYWGGNGGWGSSRNCWDVVNPAGTLRALRKIAAFLNLCESDCHNRIRGCGYGGSILFF